MYTQDRTRPSLGERTYEVNLTAPRKLVKRTEVGVPGLKQQYSKMLYGARMLGSSRGRSKLLMHIRVAGEGHGFL